MRVTGKKTFSVDITTWDDSFIVGFSLEADEMVKSIEVRKITCLGSDSNSNWTSFKKHIFGMK